MTLVEIFKFNYIKYLLITS